MRGIKFFIQGLLPLNWTQKLIELFLILFPFIKIIQDILNGLEIKSFLFIPQFSLPFQIFSEKLGNFALVFTVVLSHFLFI